MFDLRQKKIDEIGALLIKNRVVLTDYVIKKKHGNLNEVEDLIQDIMLAACVRRDEYYSGLSEKAQRRWLISVARSELFKYHQMKKRRVKMTWSPFLADLGEETSSSLLMDLVVGNAFTANSANIGNGFICSATGQVKAKEIRVTLTGWSDFVFDDGYQLPSLEQLERYVKENRHLPDVPTETEVKQGGVDLGQMNALLLQKVEELTLYIIDLQKQIDELKKNKKQ